MIKNSTTRSAPPLRSDTDWVSLYRSALISALREWPSDAIAARGLVEGLRSELEDLASPSTSWSDGEFVGAGSFAPPHPAKRSPWLSMAAS
jgi:hypothetical protein